MSDILGVIGGGMGAGGGLSGSLHAQFTDWLQARKPQELEMLIDYEHKLRISRQGDQSETGLAPAQRSRVFIGSTRSKIRSARAKIKDVLFGAGKMPFDSVPTQEILTKYADVTEEILTYQLDKMEWPITIGQGIDDAATYGTAFICGPFARMEATEDYSSGLSKGKGDEDMHRAPYFERVSPMDIYPDPEAETTQDGLGVYWATRRQPEFVRRLIGRPGYDDAAIRSALVQRIASRTDEGSDRTENARQNLYRYTKDGRIWFLRYFGLVSVRELAVWRARGGDVPDMKDVEEDERVEAMVQLAGGQVIKADVNPYHMMRRPIYRCPYEDESGEMWGTGVAKNNRDNQRVINGSFQLYLEGKAFALLKMCSIDRSKFNEREDFKLFPGKKFDMKMNLSPEERKSAIIWHDMVDVTKGWENAIELSERFSDDDTGITKYSQGNDSRSLSDTATGISLIMSASALPLKEVISNIDRHWISPMVNDLLQWDLVYLEPETVRAQLGEKAAGLWAEIKDFGKSSFITLKPTGSGTFAMREILVQKLSGFMQAALGNPITAPLIDARELLQQVWDSAEIGKESPILPEPPIEAQGPPQGMPGGAPQGLPQENQQGEPPPLPEEAGPQPQVPGGLPVPLG